MKTLVFFTSVGLLMVSLSGCAMLGSNPDSDRKREFLDDLEALKGTGPSTGSSKQAREIEKSLLGR